MTFELKFETQKILWVLVSSIGKVSNSCINDLLFNPRLH